YNYSVLQEGREGENPATGAKWANLCPDDHTAHLTLPVAGSFTPRLVSVRRRSGRRPILFVETDVPESVSMTDSNSIPSSAHPAYTEIVVVRHGETEWNADKRIQGHVDVDLNEVGRQQAALVADRLSRECKVSAVYSSDLKRAFDTAQAIADRCGSIEFC
ncbi:unnamed protein product, partial [Linum tenue]